MLIMHLWTTSFPWYGNLYHTRTVVVSRFYDRGAPPSAGGKSGPTAGPIAPIVRR
jgi:hypothetical protein